MYGDDDDDGYTLVDFIDLTALQLLLLAGGVGSLSVVSGMAI